MGNVPADSSKAATVLTVAGSDPSGGAGVEQDLQVFSRFGVAGAAILTCLTDQTSRGLVGVTAVPVAEGRPRLRAVLDDLRPAAIKIGMLPGPNWMRSLAAELDALPARHGFVLLDPILAPTVGEPLHAPRAIRAMVRHLLPRVDLLTPNLEEAAALLGLKRGDCRRDPESAIDRLLDLGPASVLLKGGHGTGSRVVDRLRGAAGSGQWSAPRLAGPPVRGTGCALSAAVVARIAAGDEVEDAVSQAVGWLRRALAGAQKRGRGRRYLDLRIDPGC